ncbi:hypothetical protein HanIR_Chr04g0168221 [Helianthus annuus]|nr:hypothetical protein HanIR_Chr04g0168221 [Helianthus annuus]
MKRHAVSLVYRTITHTACRFLHTPEKRQKYISLHYVKGYNQYPHIPTSTRGICGDDTHEPAQVCQTLRTSVVLWTAKTASQDEANRIPFKFLQASNPSCPVHNHRGDANSFSLGKRISMMSDRTSATLTPDPSRAISKHTTLLKRVFCCKPQRLMSHCGYT